MSGDEEIFDRVGDDRRSFVKKLVVGAAFAVPVVSSFSLTGMQAGFAQTPTASAGGSQAASATTSTTAPSTTTTTTTTTIQI